MTSYLHPACAAVGFIAAGVALILIANIARKEG